MSRISVGRLVSLIALLTALLPGAVLAESIDSMAVTIDVHRDATVTVVESITYDFGDAQKHGIYRDVKESYQDTLGLTEHISLTDIRVADQSGIAYPFTTSESGGYLHIRIGDANVLVSGVKTYVITYTAHDVIGFFPDHDELYWNATGDQWQVAIGSASVGVWTPVDSTSHACYVGAAGSTASCTSEARRDGANKPIALFTTKTLEPGEGLTVAVGLPKGTIAEPTTTDRFIRFIEKNGIMALPAFVFLILLLLWGRYGKDAKGRGTIIPEYEAPEGISPVAASEIVSEKILPSDISALIIRLAVGGFVRIVRTEQTTFKLFTSTDYELLKLKSADDTLSSEEKLLLDGLFADGGTSRKTSELKTGKASLSRTFKAIKKDVSARLVRDGIYRADPSTIRASFVAVGGIVIGGAWFVLLDTISLPGIVAVILSGVLIMAFSFIMPAKTEKGMLLYEQLLGLKMYLQIAEKNRLDFHNAPEKSPALFEKLLPYAMVLGVSTAWAKEFEGIYTEPPTWYTGGVYPVFSPMVFANDLDSFSTAAAAIVAPTSGVGGSGGGGFSGGGFGGGGGGSW
ncbi:MAG: hypothetical protein JWM46_147 [Candidatus Kaiserbacteria bacterium]|nr:hypothetical protein [Candidatus Kaiserbacteria bacterium]